MKAIFKKILPFLIVTLCVFGIAFLLGRCSTQKERAQNVANLKASRDSIEAYQIVVNELTLQVQQKNAIILTQEDAIKTGILEREYLRKLYLKEVVTSTSLTGTIKMLQDSLKKQPGTIIIHVKDSTGIPSDYVKLPFILLSLNQKYLSLSAGMNLDATAWYNLSVPFSGRVTVGYQKDGLFKTKAVGIVTTDNPYLKINNMEVLVVEKKKTRPGVYFVAGAVVVETIRMIFKK